MAEVKRYWVSKQANRIGIYEVEGALSDDLETVKCGDKSFWLNREIWPTRGEAEDDAVHRAKQSFNRAFDKLKAKQRRHAAYQRGEIPTKPMGGGPQ